MTIPTGKRMKIFKERVRESAGRKIPEKTPRLHGISKALSGWRYLTIHDLSAATGISVTILPRS
jgi:hypothetical protein